LFGVRSGQVWARFCVFNGKTGVNGDEGVEFEALTVCQQ